METNVLIAMIPGELEHVTTGGVVMGTGKEHVR
jgi:hypothetical protein